MNLTRLAGNGPLKRQLELETARRGLSHAYILSGPAGSGKRTLAGLLAAALSRLPAQEQEMLYLSFFNRLPQHEIGRRYGYCRSSASYHIRKVLGQLYEEMEGLAHEE